MAWYQNLFFYRIHIINNRIISLNHRSGSPGLYETEHVCFNFVHPSAARDEPE